MGIAKCSKLVAVASSFGRRFSGVYIWGNLFQTSSVIKINGLLTYYIVVT